MKFYLTSLALNLRRAEVVIDFADVSYFWGQMGAGKTSIVRLVDYCLGGDIDLSPAMQTEFVSARLNLALERANVTIERPRDSERVVVSWGEGDDAFRVSLPARKPDGEVIPHTGVEQLSDLLFWLSGVKSPRVRKSKVKQDSETTRLSMRDLLWYCYLDQDDIDSSFFHLEEKAPFYKRLKSRDVLRYVIGFHDERIAEIEAELDQLRGERQALSSTVDGLTRALKEVGVESEIQIASRIAELEDAANSLWAEIQVARDAVQSERQTAHASDMLRERARSLGDKIAQTDEAIENVRHALDRDRRHLHEIETLSLKFRRSVSAKAVLVGVEFQSCPRCTQQLPERNEGCCGVCGQPETIETPDPNETALLERDAKARIADLTDIIAKHEVSLDNLRRERQDLTKTKERVEGERNEALSRYDTAFLSMMLATERERAALLEEARNLNGLMRLPQLVASQRNNLANIAGREQALRSELKDARAAAESDATNLDLLKDYFLDCLVRSGVPGITDNDRVEITTTDFYPEVYGPSAEDTAITSFSTLSSGGKKTLFKCCFAIAVHRLAVKLSAPLPKVLIIDSPMKNISERENREQFEGFYRLLYELKNDELKNTQLILVDKEFSPPEHNHRFRLRERHMRPGDPNHPPLIPYYDGK